MAAPKSQPGPFRCTDIGNAERLAARHASSLRYCYSLKRWLAWDETRWRIDQSGAVEQCAIETVRSIYKEAQESPDPDTREALAKHALRSERRHSLLAMREIAMSMPPLNVQQDDLDRDPWLLNLSNGTLDLRSGELRPHDRSNFITKISPVEYDSEAVCPTWKSFLSKVLAGDDQLVQFMQTVVGYSLTGDTREHVLFMLYGRGANGKSTLLETLRRLLGDFSQQADFETFLRSKRDGARNDLARMAGVRFVTASEAAEGRQFDENLLKQITGQDTIAARYLYGEFEEFRPQCKIFLATNHRPRIGGTDHAIWRRIRLIPFEVTITDDERDSDLPAKLTTELPGILNWAIEGCRKWQELGLARADRIVGATSDYRSEEDLLAPFIEARCVVGKEFSVPAGQLYEVYRDWCSENGDEPVKQNSFGRLLRERGLESCRLDANTRGWRGIGVKASGHNPKGRLVSRSEISTDGTPSRRKTTANVASASMADGLTELRA